MLEEFMTAGEAMAYLGVSKQRLYELAEIGRIGRQRMGRFWLYNRRDVERYKNEPKSKGGRPKKPETGTQRVLIRL